MDDCLSGHAHGRDVVDASVMPSVNTSPLRAGRQRGGMINNGVALSSMSFIGAINQSDGSGFSASPLNINLTVGNAGDLRLVLVVGQNSAGDHTITTPAGFTLLEQAASANEQANLYGRFKVGGDADSLAIVLGGASPGNNVYAASSYSLRGPSVVDATVTPIRYGFGTPAMTANPVTATQTASLIALIADTNGGSTGFSTATAGWTERADFQCSTSLQARHAMYTKDSTVAAGSRPSCAIDGTEGVGACWVFLLSVA